MAITGWIHPTRDLRDERAAVNAMGVALTAGALRYDVVRLARRAAFAHLGLAGGYADWRHPERPDPDLALHRFGPGQEVPVHADPADVRQRAGHAGFARDACFRAGRRRSDRDDGSQALDW